jgi:anti-sigma B factor antagonist
VSDSKYVRTEQLGDALVVTPLFTFAAFVEPDLANEWSEVQKQVEAPGVKNVVVDLSAIPYFGSTVLEWMVQMWKRAKAKGGKLATCQASPIGREVLITARFHQLWGICDSRAEALAWVTAK